jgi:hypothetical protein
MGISTETAHFARLYPAVSATGIAPHTIAQNIIFSPLFLREKKVLSSGSTEAFL